MAKTITQKVVFKNTSTKELYHLYMNEKKHSELTGGSAKITSKIGAKFSAYDNYITGKNLHLLKDSLIVQTWRGSDWKKTDEDSILVLSFHQKGKDVTVKMAQINVPTEQAKGLKKGWDDFYWEPWKTYLENKK